MKTSVGHLVVGPRTHGVVRYAVAVHGALNGTGDRQRIAYAHTPHPGIPTELADCTLVHVHVTDRLFGRTPAHATAALSTMIRGIGRPVSVTLHDLPQHSDGSGMVARAAFYRDVAEHAAGVVVSSQHEASLFREHVSERIDPEVVPLMIETPVIETPMIVRASEGPRTVGVLGFVYPGKGHAEAMDAAKELPADIGFVALGMPSPGHEYLVDELRSAADRSGRSFEITGFLDDEELRARAATITVPVAYHRHLSASGSINTWIACGRKPLVPRGSYTEELNARSPGVVTLHEDGQDALRASMSDAVDDPARTWIAPSVSPVPSAADVARMYDDFFLRCTR
ncbi:hypothetical protein QMK17_05925 [Rhodococcus sp. G-MC3]|uniref:hypothetical protein n=1 Tax=Rhodococcus sp. G-MC3 TaxID=3046209 RepID=UPI0024BA2188|nr:hypothetical protein [Rhodococcus sp. G-MC3]MDJ0392866.1 hypothetical protein [Rhodococcus sp. G-MC3]